MNIPWRIPEELKARVIESLLDPSFITDETIEALQKYQPHIFSYSFLSSEGFGGVVDVTFDLLLEAGNQRAIKAYIKAGDHYSLALMCSEPLLERAERAWVECRFGCGMFERGLWEGFRDYIYTFAADNVVDRNDEDGWELTPETKAVAAYIRSQFRIYDNKIDPVCQAYNMEGVCLYHGPDRLEMYKAIYKELIK